MTKAIVFTRKDFEPYSEEMLKRGWKPTNKQQICNVLQQLEAKPPYKHPETGMEEGFEKFFDGKALRGIQWTTFVATTGMTRDGWDRGRSGILESNKFVYYCKERRRVGDYFDRLLMDAYVIEDRATHRPLCKHCGRLMKIMTTEHHQHYWYCEAFYLLEDHPWFTIRWDDIGLSDITLKFLSDKRERDKRYNVLRLKQGKPKLGFGSKKRRIWTYGT